MEFDFEQVKKICEKVTDLHYVSDYDLELFSLVKNDDDRHYLGLVNTNGVYDKRVHESRCCSFLFEVVKELMPNTILELGHRKGLSTLAIYNGLSKEEQIFVTVDIKKDLSYVPKKALEDKRFVEVIGDDLSDKVITPVSKRSPIDLLFVDTTHKLGHLRKEWELYEPFLADEALILLDDIRWKRSHWLYPFYEELEYEKFEDKKLHSSGFGVFKYVRGK